MPDKPMTIPERVELAGGVLVGCLEELGVDILDTRAPIEGDPEVFIVAARGDMAVLVGRLIRGLQELQESLGTEYLIQEYTDADPA